MTSRKSSTSSRHGENAFRSTKRRYVDGNSDFVDAGTAFGHPGMTLRKVIMSSRREELTVLDSSTRSLSRESHFIVPWTRYFDPGTSSMHRGTDILCRGTMPMLRRTSSRKIESAFLDRGPPSTASEMATLKTGAIVLRAGTASRRSGMASRKPGTSFRSRGTVFLSSGRQINSGETQFIVRGTLARNRGRRAGDDGGRSIGTGASWM
jgi:hypothetical protein